MTEIASEMTAREYRSSVAEFLRGIGAKAECHTTLSSYGKLFGVGFYQVKAFGEQACADADDIAGKGPFTIVAMGGANAEAA